ncbi:MAG: GGDEF domain-containing protein [Desulfobacterales bacterium]|nr:GGDEF domain-containing protein [Desulfobacterales bacterium]
MKNTGELIVPALESYKFFNQEFCSFNQMGEIGEHVAEKNRELIIENHNLRYEVERLKKITFIDALTEIYNKKYLEIRLGEEFARARRYGSPLSSIFIDLDNFKSINDTYGHIIGDKLLKEVASVLEGLCRSEDVLVRFGGEEFVLLMSDTTASEAIIFAERIRKKVEGHIFSYGDTKISVSASLGASTLNKGDFEYVRDPEELICMADRAMYRVKQNGKNNTCHLPFCHTSSGSTGKNLPVRENLLPYFRTCPDRCPPTQIIYKAFYFIFNWNNLRSIWIKNTEELK